MGIREQDLESVKDCDEVCIGNMQNVSLRF